MAVKCGFFNSVNGDRKYNAEDMSMYFDKLITSGVFPNPSTNLQVIASSGMTVNISPGRGIIDCHWIDNDANYPLVIEQSEATLDRIDAVIMKLDLSDNVRDIHFEVKKGTPSSNPVAPAMTRSDYIQEYCLATVYVTKLVTSISQINITDTRANTSVCGWVTGLIDHVDTETLFLQWQAAYEQFYHDSEDDFNTWFDQIKETLASATMISSQTSTYTAPADNTTEIPINIPGYNQGVDVFNAYINGMRLIKDTDYTADNIGEKITLTKGIDKNTVVAIEIYKSIDGTGAETVVGQVQELQSDVAGLQAESEAQSEALGALRNALRQPSELFSGTHTPETTGAIKYLDISTLSQYDIVIVRATIGTVGEQMLYFYKGTASNGKINQSFSIYKDANTYGTATVQYDNMANKIGLRSEAVKTWTVSQIAIKKVWGIKL